VAARGSLGTRHWCGVMPLKLFIAVRAIPDASSS
jgi:hypothetical protein